MRDGKVAPLIYSSLKLLEYRGYDSAGEATIENGKLYLKKDFGKIDEIHKRINFEDLPGKIGIGHTRWATHGAPSQINAHPHVDCTNRIAVVHNGIIENFEELKMELKDKNHTFISRTDTEVIPHLIEENLKNGMSFSQAFKEALGRLVGSYALAVVSTLEPQKIFCARKESPLIIGVAEKGLFLASDIPALLPHTNNVLEIFDGEAAILTSETVEIRKIDDWSVVARKPKKITWTVEGAMKKGYPHFMLKEIHEQPFSLREALRVQEKYLNLLATFIDRAKEIFLVASGTSYHACLAASYILNKLAKIPTIPTVASEFIDQFGDSVNIESVLFAVSQSGETADVLRAVDHARFRAATILGLTNVLGSTLTRVSRAYICQNSGPEIGVAATKTFTAQVAVLTMLALKLARLRGKISQDEMDYLNEKLHEIPKIVEKILDSQEEKVRMLTRKYKDSKVFYFLGRGVNVATALEGRLKLLEIAYIPSIAYPAGESKHGPISLIETGFPVIFICPKGETYKTMLSNIMEMKARGASTIGIIEEGDEEVKQYLEDWIEIPRNIPEILSPIPYVVPLQLFAYYMALEKGLDPDKPRNLAKSVTVI